MSELLERLKQRLAEYLADLDAIQDRVLDQLAQWQMDVAQPNSLGQLSGNLQGNAAIENLRALVARRDELLKLAQSQGIAVSTLRELAAHLDDPQKSLTTKVSLLKRKMERMHHASLGHWISCQKAWLHYSDLVELIATGGRKPIRLGNTNSLNQGGVILDAKV